MERLTIDDFVCEKTKDGLKVVEILNIKKRIIFPEGVNSIEYRKYARNEEIEELVFPDSMSQICNAYKEFSNSRFKKLTFGNQLYKIPNQAFQYCENLKGVVFPDSLRIIDVAAFLDDFNIETVTLNEGLEEIGLIAFYNSGVRNFVIPESVRSVGESAFFSKNTYRVVFNKRIDKIFASCVAVVYNDLANFETLGKLEPESLYLEVVIEDESFIIPKFVFFNVVNYVEENKGFFDEEKIIELMFEPDKSSTSYSWFGSCLQKKMCPSVYETMLVLLKRKNKCKEIIKEHLLELYDYLYVDDRSDEFFDVLPCLDLTNDMICELMDHIRENEDVTKQACLLEMLGDKRKEVFKI